MKRLFFFSFFIFYNSVFAHIPTSTTVVTPGVIHMEYTLPGPYTIDVLEIDLKNPYLVIETYKPDGLTKTTVQSAANDRDNHRVIGAVNADFFSFETGWPVGNQVVNGKPALGVAASRSALGITALGKPLIEKFSFSGKIIARNGAVSAITSVNTNRSASGTVLYTSFRGASTGTDNTGIECALALISPAWMVNDTLEFVVTSKGSSGSTAIPANGAVISAGASASSFLSASLSVNDTVKFFAGYAQTLSKLTQVIAGAGRLVRAGVNVGPTLGAAETGSDFATARHPRTFAGFNADSSKLYMCTVDGRLASSIGMSFSEMAEFLLTLNITEAFNFDGGGSTTMVVRGKVVNTPSDPGGERSVANTLQVVSIAPQGTLASLNIIEPRTDVFQGGTFQFHAEGKDQYFNPLALPAGVAWTVDTRIGSVDATGKFTAMNVNDSGWVRIRSGAIADSARIIVRVISELRVYPQSLIMVPGERLTLTVRGTDSGGNKVMMDNSQVAFVNNATGLNVDAAGVVTSTTFGSGTLDVRLGTTTRGVPYTSIGTDTTIVIEDFRDTYAWTYDVVNTDPDNMTFSMNPDPLNGETPAIKIAYTVPGAGGGAILNTAMPLSSRIDSLFMSVYGDGGGHAVKMTVADKEGQLFTVISSTLINWTNEWRTVGFKMVNAVPVSGGSIDYPVTLKQLQITIGTGNLTGLDTSRRIYIKAMKVHYPNRTVAPSLLYDFNTNMNGWQALLSNSASQAIGISRPPSAHEYSTEHPYEGAGCGKWTLVDDPAKSDDWNVRITRLTTAELGSMLRGSYIGAWVWAEGQTNLTLRTVIRDANGQICAGPAFPVNHYGWKLIGTKLDSNLFKPYLTAGKITDINNRFNGFNVLASNAAVSGQTRMLFIDKMVTSALTVPTGFTSATIAYAAPLARLHWTVNSEISIDRYTIERGSNGTFTEVGAMNAVGTTDTTQHYEFVDTPPAGRTYEYRIRQITNDGAQEVSPVMTVNATTGVDGAMMPPMQYELEQNFPNPFNPCTLVRFSIAAQQHVTLKIFDVLGRNVSTLVDDMRPAGRYDVEWNAAAISSGVYFYELRAGNFISVKKLLLQK